MLYRFLLSSILLCATLLAQEQKLEIRDFKGLNTRASAFTSKPNMATLAHNIDLSRGRVGSISKRYGYDSLSALPGMDSLVSIYGAYYSDGTQQLFVVGDSTGVGYGGIYVSPKGSINLSDSATKIWDYWGIQEKSSFAMYKDAVYIVNGTQKGIVYNGSVARQFPLSAPGEPVVVPISDTGGSAVYTLDGEYRYAYDITGYSAPLYSWDHITRVHNSYTYVDTFIIDPLGAGGLDTVVVSYTSDASATRAEIDTVFKQAIRDSTLLDNALDLPTYPNPFNNYWSFYEAQNNDTVIIITDTAQNVTPTGAGSVQTVAFERSSVTPPVRVKDGRILHIKFHPIQGDSLGLVLDSVKVEILRSLSNPGPLDERDSAYIVDDTIVNIDTFVVLVMIDSLPDTAISGSGDGFLIDADYIGRDSLNTFGNDTYSRRYGSPGFVSSDTCQNSPGDTFGVYYTWPVKQTDTIGVAYACTFIDTITGVESDTGRSLFVFNDVATVALDAGYTISLPKIPQGDSGVVINLYRACILAITHDSAFWNVDTVKDKYNPDVIDGFNHWEPEILKYRYKGPKTRSRWLTGMAIDTVITGEYHLVTQVPSYTETYVDSIGYDSLHLHRMYTKASPPVGLKNIFSFDGFMLGTSESNLYFSRLDSAFAWGAFDYISLGRDDGDKITLAYPARGVIRVLKNKSSYNVYQDDYLRWYRQEVSSHIGAVSTGSYASGLAGHYYLSDLGVLRESEGEYLERTQQLNLVSKMLDNFDGYPNTTLSKAVAFYHDQKYMLTIGDTTFVYDERADGWTTWDSILLQDATLYGVEDVIGFHPGDTMYFIRPGDDVLYRYGTSELNVRDTLLATWHSTPLLVDDSYKQISRIGVWSQSTDTTANALGILLFDENNDYLNQLVTFPALNDNRYLKKPLPVTTQLYYHIRLLGATVLLNTIIDGLDIYWIPQGESETK